MTHPVTTLVYCSVLPVTHRAAAATGGDLLDIVRGAFGSWLKGKYRRQVPLGSGHHHLDSSSLLTSHAAYTDDGSEYATRLELREDSPDATWRTTVTAVLPQEHPGAVRIDLECFPLGARPLRSGKPRLVQDLVRELELNDGLSRLTVNGLRVKADNVGRLVDVLCDPDRTLPVIVAARPRQHDPLWSERVGKTMPRAAGDASLYLLADEEAVDAFRHAVGEHHRVAPGAVRTFLTDVDPAWEPDAARHRLLALARWVDPGDQTWHGVARTVQRMALSLPQPAALRSLTFPDLGEQERRQRRESLAKAKAVVPAQRPEAAEAALREEVAVLTGLLEVASDQLEEEGRSLRLAEQANTSLSEQLQVAVGAREADMEDHLLTLTALERAQAENDNLRRLLMRQGRWEEVVAATESLPAIPASFEELWERLDAFTHLRITADRRVALGLDEHAEARTWAAKAWSGLAALNSYAEHRLQGRAGGFRHFCQDPPAGARVYPVNQIAMVESAATMRAFGNERLFPAAEGTSAEMQAHLKLAGRGNLCPRVHFMDDVAGKDASGLVIVGYMGPHLTNTRTN
ncbi:hypothetical protein [Streptomyces sp. NPDC058084]|uniref:hypothetical protein n=1 Tax=Streptomyces sp. NPDC058084 TaxID=3346333 RepID=UPI0036E96E79